MTKAKGCNFIYLLLILILLVVPATPQASHCDSPQPATTRNSPTTNAQDEKAAEQSLWDSIKESSDPQEYKTFLAKYPWGQFKDEARSRLSALLGQDYVNLFIKQINVNKQWSHLERQLRRRADVIPNLYNTLLAAGVQEQEWYGQIAEARARLLNTTNEAPCGKNDNKTPEYKTPEQKRSVIDAVNSFDKTLRRLDALLENYPQLRSNVNFLSAFDELAGAGNRLNVARADYNRAVQEYNNARRQPRLAVTAESHGFTEEPHFNSEHDQPIEPKIKTDPPNL